MDKYCIWIGVTPENRHSRIAHFAPASALAFFLATHNYDVTPKGSYVEVRLDGHVYKVAPNGNHPEIIDLN